jgi:3-hydroxyisobutyrate dehydrogenase-like beta-hydroxyacid dehydrogenase
MALIGFIGPGSMNEAMATRLIEGGHQVKVWDRSPEPVSRMVSLGAHAASSPRKRAYLASHFLCWPMTTLQRRF